MHWKTHKKLCNYLASAGNEVQQFSFFSGMANSGKEEWKTFRMNAVITCEIMMGRSLDPSEREIFLFPRACRRCNSAQDIMFDCVKCFCVSYCSEQHREEDQERHRTSCRQLRIAMLADVYESCVNVGMPAIPSHVDSNYLGTATSILEFLPAPLSSENEIRKKSIHVLKGTCDIWRLS